MKSIKKVFAILSVLLTVPSAFADTFKVEKPGSDVPPECAIFSEEKGWGQGKWGGVMDHELWVEKINNDCTAEVIYVWGTSRDGSVTPGRKRVSATIKGKKLSLVLMEFGPRIAVSYTMKKNNAELAGLYERTEDGFTSKTRITLKRGVVQSE